MKFNFKKNKMGNKSFSQINVTPFVDVMLVLLIVFMVTAPLLTVGIPVDLPKVKASALTDQKDPMRPSILARILSSSEGCAKPLSPGNLEYFGSINQLKPSK